MPSEPGQPTLEELSAFIDDELDAADQARVAEHVAGCQDCQTRLDGLRRTAHAIRGLPMETPPRRFTVPEQRRQSWRWAPAGWIGSGAVALLLIALGIHNLHLPAGPTATSGSASTISAGLSHGPSIQKGAIAPLAAPVPASNDQRFYGQASSTSVNAATVADPTNSSRRVVLGTDSPSYAVNGRMRVTIQLLGSPSSSTDSADQGLTLTLLHNGVGVALKPVGVIGSDGMPVFGGTYDLSRLPLSGPGDYRLEASWVIPDGSGRLLQASVPVRISS